MKKIIISVLLFLFMGNVFAESTFVIQKIDIVGLQNLSSSTVRTYLPVKPGSVMRPGQSTTILRDLYKTGFFEHISLDKVGHTLVIRVTERPTIGQLKISGNSVIPSDRLTTVMKSVDIAEGRIYNAAMLEKIKFSLLNQYYQLGRYNARVDVTTSKLSRNRVLVVINISEGLTAKIQRISIIGNHAFSEKQIIKALDISTPGLFTFITHSDRYAESKLEASLEQIRGFYMDHGYLRMEIKSAQAEVTPDRKSVYITVIVKEGKPYTVSGYRLVGKLIFPEADYTKLMQIKTGDVFSREKVLGSEKAITGMLGDRGYLFATISLDPKLNDATQEVYLNFNIDPNKRTYVRRITFSENTRTNDEVLRREAEQMEASPASTKKLDETKQRLKLLPFMKDVDMSINPVPDVNDQIDVNYKVKEDSGAQASFRIGYQREDGPLAGIGLEQKNFFGTGNNLSINFQRSRVEQNYSVSFTDPYYTDDGISRTFSFSISRVDPGETNNVANGYTFNEYQLGLFYGIPVGEQYGVYSRIQAGVSYQNMMVRLIPSRVSNQVTYFVNRNGRHFQEADIRLGYTRDTRDRSFFPTQGSLQAIFFDFFAPLDRNSLTFYTFNYSGKWYTPLYADKFILLSKTDLGYGNALNGAYNFPFFKNFTAGGIDSVRGFEGYTLGPRDSNGMAYGGNILVDGSLNLIFPNNISDNLRTSVYFDVGNVYSSVSNRSFGSTRINRTSTDSGPLRYSVGIEADFLIPSFGPIKLSLAKPIGARRGDDKQSFQFALGANF